MRGDIEQGVENRHAATAHEQDPAQPSFHDWPCMDHFSVVGGEDQPHNKPQRRKISIMGVTSPTAMRLAIVLPPQPIVARQSMMGAFA